MTFRRVGFGRLFFVRSFLLWAGLAACLVGNLRLAEGVYVSQMVLLLVISIWLALALYNGRDINAFVAVTSVLAVVVSTSLLFQANPPYRFVEEFGKVTMLLVGGLAMARLSAESIEKVVAWTPLLMAVAVLGAWFLEVWNYYDLLLPRFGVPMWGAPNTTAYALGIGLLFGQIQLLRYKSRMSVAHRILLLYLAMGVMAVAMIGTYSRGGMIAYLAAALYLARRHRLGIMVTSGLAVAFVVYSGWAVDIARFDVITDLQATAGNARIDVWLQLWGELRTNPFAILFGFGPGSIGYLLQGRYAIESAHSTFVEWAYQFGLVGSLAIVVTVYRFGRVRSHAPRDPISKELQWAVLIHFLVGGLLDSYIATAQLGWLSAFTLGLILLWSGDDRRVPRVSPVGPAGGATTLGLSPPVPGD